MMLGTCRFDTKRLIVREWHSKLADSAGELDLVKVVRELLGSAVTRSLPADWQGDYSKARAKQWIEDRDHEGVTLLARDRLSFLPVGLVILHEISDGSRSRSVRIGYLLAESSWGKGLASELIGGFVEWSRDNSISSIVGGVERNNVASRRVLEKNGFVHRQASEDQNERFFEFHF
jgi:RimJ/RimL family protein N-acetyltransferase